MRVTYIKHSAFLAEWEDLACLFDWAEGDLPEIEADKRLSYLRGLNNKESLLDKDTFGNKRILYWKLTNGVFVEGAFWTIKRDFRGHLKVGNVIRGPKIAYLEPGVFYELPDVYTQSEHFEIDVVDVLYSITVIEK